MCGPLVATAESLQPGRWTPWAQLPMHAGRVATYAALGVVAGLVGDAVNRSATAFGFQRVAAVLGGAAMIIIGLALFDWPITGRRRMPLLSRYLSKVGGGAGARIASALGSALASRRPASGLAVGLYWGLLPCGLVWGALLYAGASGSPARGALIMLVFGAGTLPALLVLGGVAGYLGARYRQWLARVGAASVILMGALLLLRAAANAGWIAHLKIAKGIPLF
jgi:hypothetical protein